jgi:hypothetical protein
VALDQKTERGQFLFGFDGMLDGDPSGGTRLKALGSDGPPSATEHATLAMRTAWQRVKRGELEALYATR